jgi:hypothetical protein
VKGEREEALPERFGGIKVFDLLGLEGRGHSRTSVPKALFWGEGTVVLSSYLAALVAASGMKPIFVDGANGFDPYIVSRFARRLSAFHPGSRTIGDDDTPPSQSIGHPSWSHHYVAR